MAPAKQVSINTDKSKEVSINKKINSDQASFPIVGIGTSAGGLEAMEQFLKNVPENSGMAYVIIQHLDPTHKGMLPELLQRITKMKVRQAKDGMLVRPNGIYVIPPNKSMSILHGKLQLFQPLEIRGLRLPIDFFLRSLAEDLKEMSIGLILSGMGSDGSAGLSAIKEKNGIAVVQDPVTAKYDSMPRSAIESVLVDIIAAPGELPVKLIDFLKHIPIVKNNFDGEVKDQTALEKIIFLLRTYTGNDFSMYKKSTLCRRIERRMSVHKIDKISDYVTLLKENPKEGDILFKELMIGVTRFFRDNEVWEKLASDTIPTAIRNAPENTVMRAWIPGCSTGEEAFSLAILFLEAIENINPHKNISLQIFATDLDHDAIETARKGLFPENIITDVSSDRLARYFVKTDDGFRIKSEIREMVVFAQHNLIMHPPFINIDFLSCRNLLIYLATELQKKILGLFYFSLNTKGIMVLGSSESLGSMQSLFISVDGKLKIYQRAVNAVAPYLSNFPSSFSRPKTENVEKPAVGTISNNIQTLADQLLLQRFSPPAVLVNTSGDILYISGRTGKYLEPAAGKANMNLFAMLREGLRHEFHIGFHQALSEKSNVILHNLKVGTNGNSQSLDISIQYIDKPGPLKTTLLVVFSDLPEAIELKSKPESTATASKSSREAKLENELQYTREEMQTTLEEMQTSQEELKSTNEELQSANEELQSANEELTSSKEEMQSLNEELQTLNAELVAKVEDFARVNNDMKNLLNSTDIATLFLDKELNIRRYTNQATKIFKFIKSDIGRPFTDQVSDLIYPEMAEDAIEVLKTLVFIEKQIPGKDGRWFSIRIMPYRTFDDRIDGLVITFINITELKKMEEKWEEANQIINTLLNISSDVIIKLSNKWQILEFNPEAEKVFGVKSENVINDNYLQLFTAEPNMKQSEQQLNKMLKNLQNGKLNTEVIGAHEKVLNVEWTVKVLVNNLNIATGLILTADKSMFENSH
ncbi:MAG: PAS domain-containing protein [Cyclobacteriaceae bacterium]|nr:PAS domain-containing protein [Cyclobacteriaceae bacterium]